MWPSWWCQEDWSEHLDKCLVSGSGSSLGENALLMPEVRGEWQSGLRWPNNNSNSNKNLYQPKFAKDHVWTHNTLNLKADRPQRRKISQRTGNWGSNLQGLTRTEPQIKTGAWSEWVYFCCDIHTVMSEFGIKTHSMHPSLYQQSWQAVVV